MPNTIEIVCEIKQDGVPVPGSPFIRRVTLDEVQGFAYEIASGAGYATLPVTASDTLRLLVVSPTYATSFRLNGQSSASVDLNAGGLLILVDANLTAGASTNATASNSSGSTAVLTGYGGGT